MDVRQLRAFVAVAEERSFTRAAERLHLSQPGLSAQVARLEAELGVALLDRSRRATTPTAAGQVLLEEGRRLLGGLDQAVDLVRRTGTGQVGRLRVGFVPAASNHALPPILRRFGDAHPGVRLDLRELPPDELVTALHEGRIDVAFMYLPFDDASLATVVVGREPFVAAVPAGHPLAGRAAVSVAELAGEPFVMPAEHGRPGLHAKTLELCAAAGFTPRVVQEGVWLVQTIVGLVSAGMGVALVPASTTAVRREGVAYLPLADAGAHPVELAAAWPRASTSATARAFVATLAGPEGFTSGPDLPMG